MFWGGKEKQFPVGKVRQVIELLSMTFILHDSVGIFLNDNGFSLAILFPTLSLSLNIKLQEYIGSNINN